MKFSDQIRAALERRIERESAYEISKATGIPQETLSRFRTGERGLSMETLDKLAEYLNLRLKKK